MDELWRGALWRQYGASLDMLEGCMRACPDALWGARAGNAFWHIAYHTLYYLDLYVAADPARFTAPAGFDPALRRLEAPWQAAYSKEQLLAYLADCRDRCHAAIAGMTAEGAAGPCGIEWLPDSSRAELFLYNLRHVQHHVGQLNARLRERAGTAIGWALRGQPL